MPRPRTLTARVWGVCDIGIGAKHEYPAGGLEEVEEASL